MILDRFLIIRTSTYNKFLIFSEKEYVGKVVTTNSKYNIIIKGTQILEINEEAIFYLDYMEIKFFGKPDKIEIYFSIFENFNFNFNDIIKDQTYIPIIQIDKVLKNEDFNELGKNLNALRSELNQKDDSIFHNHFHYVHLSLTGLILISFSIFGLFFIIRKFKTGKFVFFNNQNSVKIEDEKLEDTVQPNFDNIIN